MNRSYLEIATGFLITVFAGYFLFSSYNKADYRDSSKGYNITAKFDNINGINIGSEIRISGIKIGEVVSRQIDPNTYQAVLMMNIDKDIKIPADSSAEINSEGFLGGKFVAIKAGGDDTFLKDKEQIFYTQSSISLENLIGKMIFSKEDKREDTDQKDNTYKHNK
ncbi:outer membrane lipid asymmetry maintenance protein MlaD [Rickettsiales endosymbiont of Stachyamoeba lipophora]|uniref:outer membrane lipid asymmetry maintenance protein MlaD n=1 Tax=Rickettsiales endosymbiont of Stachyamoeba lipophora TaxID=2486578 RepID=UPI000F6453C4|nr:outer membrane lipid asymmetry maintenance protein MlaD [Rickettsiales endosymbiont of Stachyamoeba lipophora]AZL16027.1 outer membrane lipid asymmetry maintenance protein MlaD [Rickettsiales endosymbiont of Stachyamoeba lipophora]